MIGRCQNSQCPLHTHSASSSQSKFNNINLTPVIECVNKLRSDVQLTLKDTNRNNKSLLQFYPPLRPKSCS